LWFFQSSWQLSPEKQVTARLEVLVLDLFEFEQLEDGDVAIKI